MYIFKYSTHFKICSIRLLRWHSTIRLLRQYSTIRLLRQYSTIDCSDNIRPYNCSDNIRPSTAITTFDHTTAKTTLDHATAQTTFDHRPLRQHSTIQLLRQHSTVDCSDNIRPYNFFIIIKNGEQCKAGREWYTPYQSEDPSPTIPTYRQKEEKGKRVEDYSRDRAA